MKWESQKDAFNISMLMHVEVLSLLRNNNTLPKNIPVSRKQDISTYFTANVAFGLFLSNLPYIILLIKFASIHIPLISLFKH